MDPLSFSQGTMLLTHFSNPARKSQSYARVFGNFDPNKDPAMFNVADPVERNTVGVPSGGWLGLSWTANSPTKSCLLDPPSDLPKC
ncbi:hypothetical protein ACOSQ4_025196 [Xanthoceras sorbifolium]